MKRYSALGLLRNALDYNRNWPAAWRSPEPKKSYDAIIVGGGGHGLATAYYLARDHGLKNVAVLEKGWIGGGNTGRNTAIVRSNYLWTEASLLYEKSLKLWEGLSRDLNYNVMFSQRGVYNLGHSLQDMRDIERRVNANRLNGIDAEVVGPADVKKAIPCINTSPGARYPILGASLQRRGGVARHDAVAWGFARAADALGVDIIEQCEVTGLDIRAGTGRQAWPPRAARSPPIASAWWWPATPACWREWPACACRSRATPCRRSFPSPSGRCWTPWSCPARCMDTSASPTRANWWSAPESMRSTGYGQRGSFPVIEHAMQAIIELFPAFSRVRMLRLWGGTVDVCPDACPIVSKTPVAGPVLQLWLGHRRIQGNAGIRVGVRPYACPRPAPRTQRALQPGPVRLGRADR